MSKFPHDDFAKAYLTEVLSAIGKATPNHPLPAETLTADLWFKLNPRAQAQRQQIGLLGQLLTCDALIEVFRNPAPPIDICTCQRKLSIAECDLIRKAKRRDQNLSEQDLPDLWLIMLTASEEIRQGFGAIATSTPGVYYFPSLQRIGLIVVHQLPQTEDTLFLRILGRAEQQRRAVEEFSGRSRRSSLDRSIEELLADYRAILEAKRQLTEEEEEVMRNLSTAYLKKQEEWKQQGIEQGIEQGIAMGRLEERQEIAINLLRQGLLVTAIASATGLTIEDIEQLRQQM